MKIENIRTNKNWASEDGFECICTFSLELTPEVKLYDLELVKTPDDKFLVYAPKSTNGSAAWSMSPRMKSKIIGLASEAMKDRFLRNVTLEMHRIASL